MKLIINEIVRFKQSCDKLNELLNKQMICESPDSVIIPGPDFRLLKLHVKKVLDMANQLGQAEVKISG